MGRPRKWDSDAERKRAARAKQEQAGEDELRQAARELGIELPEDDPSPPPPPLPLVETTVQGLSEEEYVQRELQTTRAQLGTTPHVDLARSERYLRWRWRGVRDGEIATL